MSSMLASWGLGMPHVWHSVLGIGPLGGANVGHPGDDRRAGTDLRDHAGVTQSYIADVTSEAYRDRLRRLRRGLRIGHPAGPRHRRLSRALRVRPEAEAPDRQGQGPSRAIKMPAN